jgi:protein-S-isoprenylcysteine O-methyltransferase Ste14
MRRHPILWVLTMLSLIGWAWRPFLAMLAFVAICLIVQGAIELRRARRARREALDPTFYVLDNDPEE